MSAKEQYSENRKRKRIRFRILFALACIVVFATTYALILPAITMEKEVCGIEEHTHTESCYEVTEDVTETKLVCTQEHEHTDDCYETVTVPGEKTLVCGKTEHTHTIDCLDGSDQEAVKKVINLIDELPSSEEIDNELEGLEDNDEGYDAYLENVMTSAQYAHELYEELGSGLQKYVTNADKLLDLSYMWEGQVFATTDSNVITVYQSNIYSITGGTMVLYNGGTSVRTVNSYQKCNMAFSYWRIITVEKKNGLFEVASIDLSYGKDVNHSNAEVPQGGFLVLVHEDNADDFSKCSKISVGDRVELSSSFYTQTNSSSNGIGFLTFELGPKQKAEKDNSSKLTVVPGADTRDLIEVNLYDYGSNINTLYTGNNKYPGFQQDSGTKTIKDPSENPTLNTNSFNFGNNITSDLGAGKPSVTNQGGDINKTANGANSPISGAMQSTLGVDGYPALADGTSLSYLFSNSDYSKKQNSQSINGLFQYNSTTGAYTFNSRENHAQFNPSNDTFTLYNQIISSNFMMYPFGNFLPFNDIVHSSKQSSEINRAYLLEIAASAQYKYEYENGKGSEYGTLATQLKRFVSLMDKEKGNENWTGADCLKKYFQLSKIPGVPDQSNEEVNRVISNVYTIDYDEPTDFYFGMEMKMNFMQPKGGLTGLDGKQPMVFYFTGDDDVWVYLDGTLALDLSGIHRHVGGEIDFVKGEVRYYTLGVSTGDVGTTPYNTVNFSDLFDSSVLNDKGTFKDYSTHSFNFYYMERGAGSGVCRMNFNFPLLQKNSISVTKELSSNETGQMIGNPDFRFQVLKADSTDLFIGPDTEYTIKDENGNTVEPDVTHKTDENGVFTLKAGQTAVFTGISEDSGSYYVRELLDTDVFGQYATVSVDGTSTTTSHDVTVGSDQFKGVNSTVKDISSGSTVFVFNNKVDFAKLGLLSITKELIENKGNHSDTDFMFEVRLDGNLIPEGTKYKVGNTEREVKTAGIVSIKAGETAVIENILAGTEFSVVETDIPQGLVPSYELNNTPVEGSNGVSGTISTKTGSTTGVSAVKVTNTEAGTAGVVIPVTKILENPDGQEHTYTFNLKQVDENGDNINNPYTSQMSITVSGEDPVTGSFRLGYSDEDIGEYYYKITENPVEETGTVFDTSVYIVHVNVSDGEGLKAVITSTMKGDSEFTGDSLEFTNKLDSYELPQTGGPGTLLFTLGGILLVLSAGSLLIYRRRRGNA